MALLSEEFNLLSQALEKHKQKLHEEDETARLLAATLNRILMKYETDDDLEAKVLGATMTLISSKISSIESLGLTEGVGRDKLTVDQTKGLISLIRAHVSFTTDAGCRTLINAILLHVVSNISSIEVDVSFVPEFTAPMTRRFEYPVTSYGHTINYLIVKGTPVHTKFMLDSPKLAFTNPDLVNNLSAVNIYEAEGPDISGITDAIPQAIMASAFYCKNHNLSTFRSCVTNGENWVFFIFNAADNGKGGTVTMSSNFHLHQDMSGLPLVLGLLYDWINNSKEKEMQFFTYDH